ncbi:MAG: SDR family oxidoreductase [Pseudanabaenaceae cyanobacterium bins.68]|nr:SDR family oxidoreductase [Pseudanabaenaceae cyanobacterium bins.68]
MKIMITGGTKGIGRALANQLIATGHSLGIISRNLDPVLLDQGVKCLSQDLSELNQVQGAIANLAEQLGGVDVLVNSAGIGYVGNLSETPLADFQQVINLNLLSVWQASLGVLPIMRSQRQGKIINVASIAGKQAFPGWGAYCASKFALLGLTQALAAEEQSYGIQVMAVCPGSVDTPLWDTLPPAVTANFNRQAMLQPETVAETIMAMIQLPASATITELVLLPSGGVL